MNPIQKSELKQRMATLDGRARKELIKEAAKRRSHAQAAKTKESGWCIDRWMLHLLEEKDPKAREEGTVVSVAKTRCRVRVGGVDLEASHEGGIVPGDLVAVIDGRVREVFPRRTELVRRVRPSQKHGITFEESARDVIVANVDVVAVVVSLISPPLHAGIIDRYLGAIRKGGARAVVCVNKYDLGLSEEDAGKIEPYKKLGVPLVLVSAADGSGIDTLRELFSGGLAALVGHSGVGKSSLTNALLGRQIAFAGDVSSYSGKGQHTTSRSELYEEAALRIIDTPGIREFGIAYDAPEEVAECFEEIDSCSATCKFADCRHVDEPGCDVMRAVRDGTISPQRYQSYLKLLIESFPECGKAGEEEFECRNCGSHVSAEGAGSQHRNHCPQCLHSRHLDNEPGDRAAGCGGDMEPVAVWVRKGGEWAVIHRCRLCGEFASNRIAADDNEMLLLSLAVRPLSRPPFPLERLGEGASLGS